MQSLNGLDELYECLKCAPHRIGHATYLHNNPDDDQRDKCLELVLKNRIPIGIFVSQFRFQHSIKFRFSCCWDLSLFI